MAFNGCLKCQLSISTKMNVLSICTCIIDFTVRLKSIQNIKEIKPLTNTKNIKFYAIKSLNEHFIIYLVFGGKRDLYNIFNSSYREVLMYLTAFHFFQPTCRTQSESGSQSFTNGKQIIWFSGRNSLTSSSKATKIGFSRAVLRRQRLN